MNVLPPEKQRELYRLFSYGYSLRKAAKAAGVNRNTSIAYRRNWKRYQPQLQEAYDAMWEHECERCDKITAEIPDQMVMAMFDAWEADQCGDDPRSGWH